MVTAIADVGKGARQSYLYPTFSANRCEMAGALQNPDVIDQRAPRCRHDVADVAQTLYTTATIGGTGVMVWANMRNVDLLSPND